MVEDPFVVEIKLASPTERCVLNICWPCHAELEPSDGIDAANVEILVNRYRSSGILPHVTSSSPEEKCGVPFIRQVSPVRGNRFDKVVIPEKGPASNFKTIVKYHPLPRVEYIVNRYVRKGAGNTACAGRPSGVYDLWACPQ